MSTPIPSPPPLGPIRQRLDAVESDTIRPADYGAAGDGVTDDTAALQAAISAAVERGVALATGAAAYRTSDTLQVLGALTWDGRGTTLIPDAVDVPAIHVAGTTSVPVSDVRIFGLHIDGRNRPEATSSGFGSLRATWTHGLTVSDMSWDTVHEGMYLRAVEDFSVSRLRAYDVRAAVVALLRDSCRGVISSLVGTHVDEMVDFTNNSDIVVSDFVGTGRGVDGEGFDVGDSRRVTISTGTLTGFLRGILVKTEGSQSHKTWSWEDITVVGVKIFDCLEGVNVQAAAPGSGDASRISVRDVTIVSQREESIGIVISQPSAGVAKEVSLSGLSVDVAGRAVRARGVDGGRLGSSHIRSREAESVLIEVCGRFTVEGCSLDGFGASSAGTLFLDRVADGVATGNRVWSRGGVAAVCAKNGERPKLIGNVVHEAAGHGILVEWTQADRVDGASLAWITGNDIREWGLGSAIRRGIAVQGSAVSAAPRAGLRVEGNRVGASTGAVQGIGVSLPSTLELSASHLVGNVVDPSIPTPFSVGSFGEGNSVSGNFPQVTE